MAILQHAGSTAIIQCTRAISPAMRYYLFHTPFFSPLSLAFRFSLGAQVSDASRLQCFLDQDCAHVPQVMPLHFGYLLNHKQDIRRYSYWSGRWHTVRTVTSRNIAVNRLYRGAPAITAVASTIRRSNAPRLAAEVTGTISEPICVYRLGPQPSLWCWCLIPFALCESELCHIYAIRFSLPG